LQYEPGGTLMASSPAPSYSDVSVTRTVATAPSHPLSPGASVSTVGVDGDAQMHVGIDSYDGVHPHADATAGALPPLGQQDSDDEVDRLLAEDEVNYEYEDADVFTRGRGMSLFETGKQA